MDKVCFVVGEGGSERFFLSSLLENQLGFSEPEYLKGGFIFEKQGVFWVLNSPPDICSRNGKSRVVSKNTYSSLRTQEYNVKHCFDHPYEVHYLVIRDGDGASESVRQEMISTIKTAANPILTKEPLIHLPMGTIENWFIAGLTEDFEHFKPSESQSVSRLLMSDPEHIQRAKEALDSVLIDRLSKQRKIIGKEVGSVFNIEKAASMSSTFRMLWEALVERDLV